MRDNRLEVRVAYVVAGRDRIVQAISFPVFGHSGMTDVVLEAFNECRQVIERAIMRDNATLTPKSEVNDQ
jgi:hypothetical protein